MNKKSKFQVPYGWQDRLGVLHNLEEYLNEEAIKPLSPHFAVSLEGHEVDVRIKQVQKWTEE